jgi:general secretion pathway protein E
VTRLLDMGVEPFLISSSLLAIVAQRLVRRVCPSCKVPHILTEAECKELSLPKTNVGSNIFAANADGCQQCQHSGFRGRLAIHELLLIDDAIRSKIMQRADSNQIKNAAKGFNSLKMDGAAKVLQGVTTVEEVLRVSQEELLE